MVSGEAANVLVVDDRPENLLAMRAALDDPRLQIDTVSSGPAALRNLLANHYSAVLLDVAMPGMNGFEVASLIRKREKDRSIPIILITAFATDEAQVARGFASGASDYLQKPIDPAVILAKVLAMVDLYVASEKQTQRALREESLRRAQLELELEQLRHTCALQNEAYRELEFSARTPLTTMKLRTQKALHSLEFEEHPALVRELRLVDHQVDRLIRLIDDADERWAAP